MVIVSNECVGCETCYNGADCVNRHVHRYYCDKCREETTLYDYDGEQLCESCLISRFDIVEGSDWA